MLSSRLFAAFASSPCSRITARLYGSSFKCSNRRICPVVRHTIAATLSSTTDIDSAMGLSTDLPDHGGTYQGEILCNRALNMANIAAVGFDMDYTLAMYKAEKFESLSARGALQKLVHEMAYPKELLEVQYDHSFFIRGLVVDKIRGNIIKLDRHKYCKRALHGFRTLGKAERAELYDAITTSGGGYAEPAYAVLDTIFSLPDAFLFASVVDHKDTNPGSIEQDYATIYADVRRAVDLCHRDGYIKDRVGEDPAEYIMRDERMVPMLRRMRRSGRKVFLLTNSLYDYTDTVMRYLYAGADAAPEEAARWTELFDVIVAGSCKPAFMLDPRRQLYRVDPETHALYNTEGAYREEPEEYLKRGKTFQGGSYPHLHSLLGVRSGAQVLYVGDHMFSDILRSKRTLGWRTMLIVPELTHEINVLRHPESLSIRAHIDSLALERDSLDEQVDRLQAKLVDRASDAPPAVDVERDLADVVRKRARVRAVILEELEKYQQRFHFRWGQLLKTGLQNSRFAQQVENYA
eukprot:IDg12174t1